MWQFAMILERSPVGRVVQLQRGCQVAMDSAKQRNAIPLILGRHPHGEVRPGIERDGGRGIVLGSAAWKERRTDTILAVAEFQFRARGAPPGGLDGKSPAIATHPTAQQVAAVGVGVVVDAVPIEKRTALIRSGEPGGWRFHPKIPSRQAGDHGEIDARIEPRTPGRRQRKSNPLFRSPGSMALPKVAPFAKRLRMTEATVNPRTPAPPNSDHRVKPRSRSLVTFQVNFCAFRRGRGGRWWPESSPPTKSMRKLPSRVRTPGNTSGDALVTRNE